MSEHTQESTRLLLTDLYISVQSQGDLCSQCMHAQLDRVNIDSELVQLYNDQIPRLGED